MTVPSFTVPTPMAAVTTAFRVTFWLMLPKSAIAFTATMLVWSFEIVSVGAGDCVLLSLPL